MVIHHEKNYIYYSLPEGQTVFRPKNETKGNNLQSEICKSSYKKKQTNPKYLGMLKLVQTFMGFACILRISLFRASYGCGVGRSTIGLV